MSQRDGVGRTIKKQLLSYAIGRGIESADLPASRRIVRDAGPQDYKWSAIIAGVVRSAPFSMSTSAPAMAVAHETNDRGQTR
jgi:hypothetical protein